MKSGCHRTVRSTFTLGLVTIGLCTSISQAALFLTEQFNYADTTAPPTASSSLVTVSGGLWAAHSGSNGIQVTGTKVKLLQVTRTEDDNRALGPTMGAGQKYYAAFDVVVAPNTGVVDYAGTADYFAHFKDNGTFQFRARVFVGPTTDGTHPNFNFGLSTSSVDTTGTAMYPAGHPVKNWDLGGSDYGTNYRIVTSYAFDSGDVEMWITPVGTPIIETDHKISIAGDPGRVAPAAPDNGVAVSTYAFRQGGGGVSGMTETIDNLCTGSTFNEAFTCTSSGALTGFGASTPASPAQGDSVLLTVTVSGGTPPYTVQADLSALGGSPTQQFFDDATNGDATSGDNTFSFRLNPVNCTQAIQTYLLDVTVSDSVPTTVTPHPKIGLNVVSGAVFITEGQPSDRVICSGATTFFSVNATGGGLTYQWYNSAGAITDGVVFSGATTRQLTITGATAVQAALNPYYVKVKNGACPAFPEQTPAYSASLIIDSATANDKQVVISQVFGGAGCTNGTQCASNLCTNNACNSNVCNVASSNEGAACTVNGDCPPKACTGAQDCGGNPTPCALYDSDYIELYNKGTSPVNLKGWSVQYGSIGGTWLSVPLSATDFILKPGQYFLVKEAQGAPGTGQIAISNASANVVRATNMSATAAYVALYKSTALLPTSNCPVTSGDCLLVDFVGYGTAATCFEGSDHAATPNVAAGLQQSNAVTRLLCTDTDQNASDFAIATASPHNSSFTGSAGIGGNGTAGVSDLDLDGVITSADLSLLTACLDGDPKHQYTYNPNSLPGGCNVFKGCDGKIQADIDRNGVLNMSDFGLFQKCFGATPVSAPACFH